MDESWSPPMIWDRDIGSNTCDLESCCRSSGPCRESRGFGKFSPKRTCWSSARSVEGESGGRPFAIASPVRLNWSRTVNWSPSARRMESNSGSYSGFHSSIPLSRSRCPLWGSRAPYLDERQLPSPESCYTRYEVSLPCDTQVLNCTRVCTSHRKVETGLDLWRSRAETLDIPVSTYLARGVTSPIPISETSRRRTDLGRSTSTSRALATRHAPAEPPLPSDREGGGHHRTGEPAFTARFLCNRAARWRHRHSLRPGPARAFEVGHDCTLY